MADLSKVLEHVDAAERELKAATGAMAPITAIRTVEAYILGALRGALVVCRETHDAIMQSADFKGKRQQLKDNDEPPPQTLKG